MSVWKVEDELEDAFEAILTTAAVSGLSTCKTYSTDLPSLPYCAILAMESDRLIPNAPYGSSENRKVMVRLLIAAHSQDYTRATYQTLVAAIMDAVYVDDLIAQLNAGMTGVTAQKVDFGKISRGVTEHTFETTVEIAVEVYTTT